MRILFYNHAGQVSGAERSLLTMAHGAWDAGHGVRVAAPDGDLVAMARRDGLPVDLIAPFELGYARDPRLLALYAGRAVLPVRDLAAVVRRTRPDLVHANSIRSGLVAALALRMTRPRPTLVVHLRDALQDNLLGRATARLIFSTAARVVAISRYVGDSTGRPDKVSVLHNAVDPERYRGRDAAGRALRARLDIAPEAPLLAVVGQISPWKGQDDAIEALALVRRTVPGAHLLVAGSNKFPGAHRRYDNASYEQVLKERAAREDVAGHVHFLGEVAEAASIYAAATALLTPSWAEPFGRVVIEAMVAGCPVIATNAGGVPEIVMDGVDGLLVPPRDPVALAAAVLTVLRDPLLGPRLAREGQKTAAARFTLATYVPHVLRIWEDARTSR